MNLTGRQTQYLVKILSGCVEFGKFISTTKVSDNKKDAEVSLVGASSWGTCHPHTMLGLVLVCQCRRPGSEGGFALTLADSVWLLISLYKGYAYKQLSLSLGYWLLGD